MARLVGVGLGLPLDGSSFVRHVGAFQGFISSLSLADLASMCVFLGAAYCAA
jgi:hypothetical protein